MKVWSWGKFEREALDACGGWRVWCVWPQFFLEMAYLVAAPIHDRIQRSRMKAESKEADA